MTTIDLRASDDSSGESASDEVEVHQEQNRTPELFYQKLPGRTIDPKKLLALLKSKFGGDLEDGQYTVSVSYDPNRIIMIPRLTRDVVVGFGRVQHRLSTKAFA